jgi:hypothetical protein
MSRSPSPVEWSPIDLTRHWPVSRLPRKLEARDLSRTDIDRVLNNVGGYLVVETWVDSAGEQVQEHSVPAHYRNAFCILTAKIRWLQVNCVELEAIVTRKPKKSGFHHILDGLRRNLLFTMTIRHLFYAEIAVPRDNSPTFRSPSLDSWLHVEYNAITHNPPRYRELRHMKYVDKHPKDIDLDGKHSCVKYCGVSPSSFSRMASMGG